MENEPMKLFDYQVEDAGFLAGREVAGLFSGMGSGKTLVALEACKIKNANKIIIVGPPISLSMWATVAAEHLGREDIVILRSGKTAVANAGIIICSYTIATTRRAELVSLRADVLIMDESHAIKTPGAKRTQALIGYDEVLTSICDSVTSTYFLSGTPSVRWSDDLYTYLVRACPDVLREKIGGLSLDKFRLRYCVTQLKQFGKGHYRKKVMVTVGNRNLQELNDMLFHDDGHSAIRRELAEVWAAMPDLTVTQSEISLDLTKELRASLKQVEGMSISQIQADLSAKEPELATIRRQLGEAKVKASVSELTARILEGNGPILVGCWHRNVIDGLTEGLTSAGIRVQVLDGRTSSASKQIIQDLWNLGRYDILIAQTAAAGISLNLQDGGHQIVEIEQDWSPAIQDQFRARLLRIGQRSHVRVDVWSSDTKLDKAIRQISGRKAAGHKRLMEQEVA
jgi:SWI/SNF-related matrix-associated actin-dependent regulator 1 of chromatin subfamily A